MGHHALVWKMKRAGDDDQRDLVVCAHTAKMLTLVQDEVGWEGI